MNALRFIPFAAAFAGLWLTVVGVHAQRNDAFQESRHHPALNYSKTAPSDAIAALNAKLESGALTLAYTRPIPASTGTLLPTRAPVPNSPSLLFPQQ